MKTKSKIHLQMMGMTAMKILYLTAVLTYRKVKKVQKAVMKMYPPFRLLKIFEDEGEEEDSYEDEVVLAVVGHILAGHMEEPQDLDQSQLL